MPAFFTDATPNTKASEAIRGKSPVTREVFQSLLPELQADAFVIAEIEAFDVLQRIRDTIAELPLGGDWKELKAQIVDELGPYFDTEAAALRRAELLLRMHGFRAYSAANHRLIEAHADVFPFCQYVCTTDGRERATHGALHGKVLPTNHPFWRNHTGPWEYGCRCGKSPLTAEEADEIAGEDATKPAEKQKVLTGAILNRLELTGILFTARPDPRGGSKTGAAQDFDVRTPKERGESEFEWRAGDTGIPLSEIRDRYDAETWAAFMAHAKATEIRPGLTVWQWLQQRG